MNASITGMSDTLLVDSGQTQGMLQEVVVFLGFLKYSCRKSTAKNLKYQILLSINILVRQVNEVLININLIYKRPSYIVTCVSCFWF